MQRDGTLLAVADHRVRGDDVLPGVGREDQLDVQRLAAVGHLHDGFGDIGVGQLPRRVRHVAQFGVHIPVGVGDAQGRFAEIPPAHRGICRIVGSVVAAARALEICQRGRIVDAASEMAEADLPVGAGDEHDRYVVGADVDKLLRRSSGRRACGQGGGEDG